MPEKCSETTNTVNYELLPLSYTAYDCQNVQHSSYISYKDNDFTHPQWKM